MMRLQTHLPVTVTLEEAAHVCCRVCNGEVGDGHVMHAVSRHGRDQLRCVSLELRQLLARQREVREDTCLTVVVELPWLVAA